MTDLPPTFPHDDRGLAKQVFETYGPEAVRVVTLAVRRNDQLHPAGSTCDCPGYAALGALLIATGQAVPGPKVNPDLYKPPAVELAYGDPCKVCGQDGWPVGSQGGARIIHEREHGQATP